MHQVMSAITYCHYANVVHRDIKPENIMVMENKGQIMGTKLVNFGQAAHIGDMNVRFK